MRLSQIAFFIGVVSSSIVAAEDVKIVGTIDQTVKTPNSRLLRSDGNGSSDKHISLL